MDRSRVLAVIYFSSTIDAKSKDHEFFGYQVTGRTFLCHVIKLSIRIELLYNVTCQFYLIKNIIQDTRTKIIPAKKNTTRLGDRFSKKLK